MAGEIADRRWAPARILVAGADPSALEATLTRLEAWGAQPAAVFSWPLAAEAFERLRPHLAVLDLGVQREPDAAGITFLQRLRSQILQGATPVPLVLLGNPDLAAQLRGLAGPWLHLVPHGDAPGLAAALAAALDEAAAGPAAAGRRFALAALAAPGPPGPPAPPAPPAPPGPPAPPAPPAPPGPRAVTPPAVAAPPGRAAAPAAPPPVPRDRRAAQTTAAGRRLGPGRFWPAIAAAGAAALLLALVLGLAGGVFRRGQALPGTPPAGPPPQTPGAPGAVTAPGPGPTGAAAPAAAAMTATAAAGATATAAAVAGATEVAARATSRAVAGTATLAPVTAAATTVVETAAPASTPAATAAPGAAATGTAAPGAPDGPRTARLPSPRRMTMPSAGDGPPATGPSAGDGPPATGPPARR